MRTQESKPKKKTFDLCIPEKIDATQKKEKEDQEEKLERRENRNLKAEHPNARFGQKKKAAKK